MASTGRNIRFTDAEWEAIQATAKARGMTASAWVRSVTRQNVDTPAAVPPGVQVARMRGWATGRAAPAKKRRKKAAGKQ